MPLIRLDVVRKAALADMQCSAMAHSTKRNPALVPKAGSWELSDKFGGQPFEGSIWGNGWERHSQRFQFLFVLTSIGVADASLRMFC
jgi:hypothetical protein